MKCIIFDFDGVIVDSVYECYIVSLKAYKDVGGNLKGSETVEKKFKKARPYVRFTEDFYPILWSIENGYNFKDLSSLKTMRKKFKKISDNFQKRFYIRRRELQKKDIKKWLGLHRPYTKMIEVMKNLSRDYKIFIATTKDKNAVLKLLRRFGLNISSNRIITREFSKDKAEQIMRISKKYRIPLNKILFIEDLFENILSAKRLKIKLGLVSWGYSTKVQRKVIKDMGIEIIKPSNIEKQIRDILND